jgi:polysaccharide export outer membrane protein
MIRWYRYVVFTAALSLLQAQTTAPADSPDRGANLPSQKIGKDDLLNLTIYGAPELSRTLRVQEDGAIRLPMTNSSVKAAGLMPNELESSVAEAIRNAKILVEPLVTVTVTEYRSRPVSVVGAVVHPTTFQAVGDMTLLEALGRAGGLAPSAGSEILISTAASSETRRISLRALLEEAKPEVNIKLQGGEHIRVPEAGRVFVIGNVKRPGAFPIQDADGASVLKILAYSEGLTQYASKVAYVYRKSNVGAAPHEIAVEIRKLMERKEPDFVLKANDVLYVPEDGKRRATFTTLEKLLLFGSASSAALIYGVAR